MADPRQGEVWFANLDPVAGHEQAGRRPVLIVSIDPLNASASELVIALPITRTQRGVSVHVAIQPPDGGLRVAGAIMCDQIRTLAKLRLGRRVGAVSDDTFSEVRDRLRYILGLP
ncbi:MAG: type II toxin-antitoxin system PemK/MazF family toxin [Dehalococcoidia bacterium]